MLTRLFAFIFAFVVAASSYAFSMDDAKGIAIGDTDRRIEALNKSMLTADDKLAAYLKAISEDAVKVVGDKIYVVNGDKVFDPVTGAQTALPADAEDVIIMAALHGDIDRHILPRAFDR